MENRKESMEAEWENKGETIGFSLKTRLKNKKNTWLAVGFSKDDLWYFLKL